MSNKTRLAVNLEKIAAYVNWLIPVFCLFSLMASFFLSSLFYIVFAVFFIAFAFNVYFLFLQKNSVLLSNFGIIALFRYFAESVGPELRQYFFSSDTEERPFNRTERSEIYRKAKGVDSSSAFGSQYENYGSTFKLRHSMFPTAITEHEKFSLYFGEERKIKNIFSIQKPLIVSAMSFGALGQRAVQALTRGAKKAGVAVNTGEGGFPKYHHEQGADLIFQIGTAKFGVRDENGNFSPEKLKKICELPSVKMIELKLSQGAKPGKGGLLPKEKITAEIAELRGVEMGKDIVSPAFHPECDSAEGIVRFTKELQEISGLPVGIKLCFGRKQEFAYLVHVMKESGDFPDFIAVDGGEGGTGAAPKSFMDDVGMPLFHSLPWIDKCLRDAGVRNKTKIIAAGKLINAGKHFLALSLGADACYSARGFLLALGCIQSLTCNANNCPVGITTHDLKLQSGFDVESRSERIVKYMHSLEHEYEELMASMGIRNLQELCLDNVYFPSEEDRYKALG